MLRSLLLTEQLWITADVMAASAIPSKLNAPFDRICHSATTQPVGHLGELAKWTSTAVGLRVPVRWAPVSAGRTVIPDQPLAVDDLMPESSASCGLGFRGFWGRWVPGRRHP